MKNNIKFLVLCFSNLGLWETFIYYLQWIRRKFFQINQPYILISKYSRFPLLCRGNTDSDRWVFDTVFTQREYSCLDDVTDAGLIIDCGANVGYSSAYFLSQYPKAYVIAVEPDSDNYAIMIKNLAHFNGRVKTLNTAIWSHKTNLAFVESSLGLGMELARQLREPKEGEGFSISATDIDSIINSSGFSKISILKIDVEGAEEVIFANNFESWITKVENLVIELHSERARSIFEKAISNVGFKVAEFGELTVCKRE